MQTLDKVCIDRPTPLGQDRLDNLCRAKYAVVLHSHNTPAPVGLDHLRIEQTGLRHPSRPGPWALSLAAPEVPPATASTGQLSTVLGATSKTRATARIPNPSASAALAHTNLSGPMCWP